jgi:hypothetical protein
MAGFTDFTVDDLESSSRVVREAGIGATDMAATAQRITDHLHRILALDDGTPACVEVSLQKTHPYRFLPDDVRAAAGDVGAEADTLMCLVGMARTGAVVPSLPCAVAVLPLDAATVAADPFLPSMTAAMGFDTPLLTDPVRVVQSGLHREDLAAFHLPHLVETSWLGEGARAEVAATGARSLLVLGGGLPTGDLFFVWLVGRDQASDKSARFIRALTPAIKAALIPHALRPWQEDPTAGR